MCIRLSTLFPYLQGVCAPLQPSHNACWFLVFIEPPLVVFFEGGTIVVVPLVLSPPGISTVVHDAINYLFCFTGSSLKLIFLISGYLL